MKLDLNEIAAQSGRHLDYEINEPPIKDLEGAVCTDGVKGLVRFSNTGKNIVVRGEFKTTVELECGRCLKPFRMDISVPIEEALSLAEAVVELDEEDEHEPADEEADVLFIDNVFDLNELIRQSILINIPIRPLCSEECKGLCPKCGRDLRDGPCGCVLDEETSPFGALASLLEQDNDTKTESGDE